MTDTLHEWLTRQRAKSCEWCMVSLFLNLITIGLVACLHWGA